MSSFREQEINLLNILEVLWRRKGIVLLFVIVALALAVTLNAIMKPVYRSSVSLLLSKPTYNINFYKPGEPKIETTPLPLESVEVLESIVKDGNLVQKVLAVLQTKGEQYAKLKPGDLQGKVNIRMDKETGLMDLKIDDTDPAKSAEIANYWSQYLIDQIEELNSQENRNAGTFITKELEQAKVNMSQVESNLKKFDSSSNLELYQKELSAKINQVAELEQKAAKAEVLAGEISIYLNQLDQRIKEQGESSAALVLANRMFLQDVQKRLLDNESFSTDIGFDEDWKTEADNSPKQTSSNYYSSQILQLDNAPQDFIQQVTALKMIKDNLNSRKEYLQSYLPALKPQISQLKGKYSQENLRKAELKRLSETAKNTYNILTQKEAEIKVAAGTKMGQLRIIKAASMPLQPYLPKKKLNILVALVISLVIGGYAALSMEGKLK
ncbi:MAG: Wzz/FepE/Etk N-terminal domain-containing protein [bacterium]|nr:Wzz/FepE/Etk N-terminal domain-containing protein [bacterium]